MSEWSGYDELATLAGGDFFLVRDISDNTTPRGMQKEVSADTVGTFLQASFLQIANDLSDLADASTARTNLGVVIGSDVQAYSAILDEYAAVNPTAAGLALLDDANAAAQLITLGLTATASELNILDGATLTVTELNYVDGVTSAIQTQLDGKFTLQAANVVNESGADVDQRFEGDTDVNLLFLDASTDRLGIGTNSPGGKLHVSASSDGAEITAYIQNPNTSVSTQASLTLVADSSLTDNGVKITAHSEGNGFESLYLRVRENSTYPARIALQQANTVFNESGLSIDHRFEGDADANLLFLDASSDRIGIGNDTPSTKLNIGAILSTASTAGNTSGLGISSTSTVSIIAENTGASGSGAGTGGAFYSNDGAAMASGDRLGFFLFGGSSSASAVRNTVGLFGFAAQAFTDGSAYGSELRIETTPTGATARSNGVIFTSEGGMTINEQGRDADTRIESDTNVNMLFVDAGANRVGIGTGTPSHTLEVNGAVHITGDSLYFDNDKAMSFADGSGGNNSMKSGSDGTFIFDINAGNSVKIKGGDAAGAEALHYTDSSFNTVWQVDTSGNVNAIGEYRIDGTKVVGNRVVDARCDDAINSGDATTDGVIDSLRDAMISHGLVAAA